MIKGKKLTQQQLFLPVVCVLLVLAVNIVYDVVQGRDFYDFFKIGIENGLLSGRIISILNRGSEVAILSIADAFDAMTSDRPYRKAMPKARALDVLRAEAGNQFHSEVVAAMEEVARTLDLP